MNDWIKFIKIWAYQHNMSYGDALKSPECKYAYKNKNIKGSGLINDLAKKAGDILIGRNTINKMDALINGRNNYPPKVRDILSKYGNEIIINMVIKRAPLTDKMMNILNIVSLGDFKKKLDESPYDKLFHLQLFVQTENNNIFSIEKNEVINMNINPKTPPNSESSVINPIKQGITINTLLNNTYKYLKNSMFSYSAKNNNCQDFILGILNANDLGNEENKIFIKQDVDNLFDSNDYLRKITNTITKIGEKVNILTTGGKIKNNKLKYKI